ncbi:trypsin-5-like [Cylas formicarius]|uniref:trypsin-5-like n=1 Tax=Cylas formicarius TaxID=197179 RepID=UPI002958561A|nr:trypsin-5-like [Cylas formicarius]
MATALIVFVVCLTASLIQGVPHGSKPGLRIVGGEDADIQDYPYQVAFFRDDELVCQGSIVAPSYVLTTGHCYYDIEGNRLEGNYSLRVGSSQLSSGGQVLAISEVIFYEPYQMFLSDLALLKLETPLEYGPSVQAVRLPEKDRELRSDEPAVATGWGSTIVYPEASEQLQQVELNVVLHDDCKPNYGVLLGDNSFCAQYAPGGRGICAYDSGAPLVANGTLIGVGEISLECGNFIGLPGGAFANVALYRDWIASVIGV